jgi:hypothetical protein
VLEKRIVVARQPIPVGGGDRGDALDDLEVDAPSLADRQL